MCEAELFHIFQNSLPQRLWRCENLFNQVYLRDLLMYHLLTPWAISPTHHHHRITNISMETQCYENCSTMFYHVYTTIHCPYIHTLFADNFSCIYNRKMFPHLVFKYSNILNLIWVILWLSFPLTVILGTQFEIYIMYNKEKMGKG